MSTRVASMRRTRELVPGVHKFAKQLMVVLDTEKAVNCTAADGVLPLEK